MLLIYRQDHGRKISVRKTLVGNFWYVILFVVNKNTGDFIDRPYAQKKITRFIPSVILSIIFSISPTEEPYVILLVS